MKTNADQLVMLQPRVAKTVSSDSMPPRPSPFLWFLLLGMAFTCVGLFLDPALAKPLPEVVMIEDDEEPPSKPAQKIPPTPGPLDSAVNAAVDPGGEPLPASAPASAPAPAPAPAPKVKVSKKIRKKKAAVVVEEGPQPVMVENHQKATDTMPTAKKHAADAGLVIPPPAPISSEVIASPEAASSPAAAPRDPNAPLAVDPTLRDPTQPPQIGPLLAPPPSLNISHDGPAKTREELQSELPAKAGTPQLKPKKKKGRYGKLKTSRKTRISKTRPAPRPVVLTPEQYLEQADLADRLAAEDEETNDGGAASAREPADDDDVVTFQDTIRSIVDFNQAWEVNFAKHGRYKIHGQPEELFDYQRTGQYLQIQVHQSEKRILSIQPMKVRFRPIR